MKTMKTLLMLPLLAIAAVGSSQNFPTYEFKNKPVPAFKLESTTGAKLTPASLKGKVYLIDFWATWCGPCKAAMPTMQRLNNKYKAQGFQVIGANILEHDANKPAVAAKFKAQSKLNYTFAKNTPDSEKFADTLKVQGIPTFILVDKKGVIREVQVGFSSSHEADLAKKIESLLKG